MSKTEISPSITDALDHYAEVRHRCGPWQYSFETAAARSSAILATQQHGAFEQFVFDIENSLTNHEQHTDYQ